MMTELRWSKRENIIARRAFDAAYQRECAAIAKEIRKSVAHLSDPSQLWRIHDFLTGKRNDVERKYDYRYSVLIWVFGMLVREGWLTLDDLAGLSEEKIVKITCLAEMK